MLIDHIGLIFFPDVIAFRCIGRLAMPIFSYCIAQGCIHTKNRKKYFLRVFVMGLLCELIYVVDFFIFSNSYIILINILLVFSMSIVLCCIQQDIIKAVKDKNRADVIKHGIRFFVFFLFVLCVSAFCRYSYELTKISFILDYSLIGVILPLFGSFSKDKRKSVGLFSVAMLFYCLISFRQMPIVWFSLLSIPLLFMYNGKRGRLNLKYAFYLFYPLHIAVLYAINYLCMIS